MADLDDEIYGKTGRHRPRPQVRVVASNPDPIYALVWFDQIEPRLDVRDFVQGLLLEQSAAVVYGDSNAGKTFWTTDLALHIAAGRSFDGLRVEQRGVVYCALEGGLGFRNRVSAWKLSQGLDDAQLPFAAIESQINLLDGEADVDRLISTVQAAAKAAGIDIGLIIIDTLARALAGGNENASEDMGALVLNMDRIRQETGSAVLFVHHSGKDHAKGARGHSSLRAAIDTEIEVRVDETTNTRTATVVKQREMPKGRVFAFSLQPRDLGRNRHGEPVTTCLVVHSSNGIANLAMGPSPHTGARAPTRLNGACMRALQVLSDVVYEKGVEGWPGLPNRSFSVPVKWWRDRFYDQAAPGAVDDDPKRQLAAKKKAFARAADTLVERGVVGMAESRVWIVKDERNHSPNQLSETDAE